MPSLGILCTRSPFVPKPWTDAGTLPSARERASAVALSVNRVDVSTGCAGRTEACAHFHLHPESHDQRFWSALYPREIPNSHNTSSTVPESLKQHRNALSLVGRGQTSVILTAG